MDVPYSAKVKTPPLGGGLQTLGHYGTRVRCQSKAPQRGAYIWHSTVTLALHGVI